MIHVRGPDGAIVQFPDGTPVGEMQMAMAHHYGAPDNAVTRANADAQRRVANTPAPLRAFNAGAAYGLGDEIDGAGAKLETMATNALKRIQGQPIPYTSDQAQTAVVQANRNADADFAAKHPALALGLQLVGGVAAPGALAAGRFVGGAQGLAGAAARSALVGGVSGAAYGAGNATGGIGARVAPALGGAVIGAGTGAAIPAVLAGAGGLGNTIAHAGNNVARAVGLVPPEIVAAQQLAQAVGKDATNLPAAQAAWPGVSTPTIADLAGENTRAAIRNAGTVGPARQTLAQYQQQVAADLQDHAIALTRNLTPDEPRTAQQVQDALLQQRADNARTLYAGPYSQSINITPEVASALRDPEGRAAVDRAIAGSRGVQDYAAMSDLQGLKSASGMSELPGQTPVSPYYTSATADPPLPPTTGRALDRIQIAFGRTGRQLQDREGAADLAAGQFKRQGVINDALDSFEGLQDARTDYRNLSQQAQAVDHGLTGVSAMPADFAAGLAGFGTNAAPAQVGYRQALTDALGRPTEGAQGAINRISTSTNQGLNLAAAFGQPTADAYQAGLGAEGDRMANANYMAPQLGSKTISSAQDAGHFNPLKILGGLLHGPDLTDAERLAIVQAGLGSDPSLLQLPQHGGSGLLGQWGPYMAAPAGQITSGLLNQ